VTAWSSEARIGGLFRRLESHADAAIQLRRRIHAEPRLGGHEEETTAALSSALGLSSASMPSGGAVLRIGERTGPAVGLRAELDALPIIETTGVPWSASNGAMHACGHDVHMAAAFAVVRTLQDEGPPVPLVLVLQPREETLPSGAKDVIDSTAFTAHDIRAFIGVHVQPRLLHGHFSATPGPVNAAADEFSIVINGRPGHAAYPHLTADPVVASADLIGTLQQVIARQIDPVNPTVLTIGTIDGGNSPNVVPAAVRLTGILRTFDENDRVRLHGTIGTAAEAVANVHGCDADVEISRGAPVLVNDSALTTEATTWLERVGLTPAPPLRSCGADDFSYYCTLCPSLMVFVGVGSEGRDEPGLHHPAFLPSDQSVIEVGKAMLAAYLGACSSLTELAQDEL
jgi:amidohydrolase